MQSGNRKDLIIGLSLLACALVFLADLALPLGVGIWLGYLLIVTWVAWSGIGRFTIVVAALSTALIILGFFLSPPGSIPWIAAVNRSAGILLTWGAAFLISSRRQLLAQVEQQAGTLASANEELALQAEKLTAAYDLMQQQADQLADANHLLQNQAEELEVQAEELQSQNEELITLTENLEQRVQERTVALRQANQALRSMSARLVAVQENERRAISRELHDESGQLLTSIMIRLGMLRQLAERGESLVEAIDDLKQTAGQLAEGLHRMSVNLRPASLDRAGLVAALQQYLETYRKTYNIQADMAVDGFDADRLPPDLESTLYRIIQEALTNVARHAHAGHVGLILNQQADRITAIIEDDGAGFDVEAAGRAARLGLTGMRERAELRGGSLTIESQPGMGTTVFVEIPCPAPSAALPSVQPFEAL